MACFFWLLRLSAVALVALLPFCAGQPAAASPTTVLTLRAVNSSFAATGAPSTGHASVARLELEGSGPQWRVLHGVGCLWVEAGEAFSFRFRNELEVADLLHLHGQTPLYTQDGVAYLSSLPAPPNGGFVDYHFNATRAGTYFLHSHVGFHEGNGASIPVIVNAPFPSNYPLDAGLYDSASVEQIIMKLEDYCPYAAMVGPTQNPQCSDIAAVHRTFVNFADTGDVSTAADGGELERMATALNGVGMLPSDRSPYGTSSSNTNAAHDMSNMGGMGDMGGGSMMPDEHAMLKAGFNFSQCLPAATMPDLIFRYHLVNGQPLVPSPPTVRLAPGATVRLRLINAASMTNYRLDLGNLTGILIATDGHFIYPDSNNQFWIAVAQRLDILLQLPNRTDVFPLFATSEFDQQRSGIVLVTGAAGDVPPTTPAYTVQGTDIGLMDDAGMSQEGRLRAFGSTALAGASSSAQRDYILRLTGAMGFMGINEINYHPPTSYNGETVSAPANPAPVLVDQNQRICLQFVNHNFDGHPMHLHGHVFQVVELNGVAIQGAVRDTVYVPRGNCQTVTVCFVADNPGIHALHCHAALHMMDGMMTTVQYPGFTQMGVLSSGAAAASHAIKALAITLFALVIMLTVGPHTW